MSTTRPMRWRGEVERREQGRSLAHGGEDPGGSRCHAAIPLIERSLLKWQGHFEPVAALLYAGRRSVTQFTF
jgi:hypothetical protein